MGETDITHNNSKQPYNISNSQIDIIAGISAGIVSTIISHPLDTIKVRIQLNKSDVPLTIRNCFSDLYIREGVSNFSHKLTLL